MIRNLVGALSITDASEAALVLVTLAGGAVTLAGWWRVLVKAGQPGWPALVPFYNFVALLSVIDQPWWLVFGVFIPFVVTPWFPVAAPTLTLVWFFTVVVIFVQLGRAFGRSWQFVILVFPVCIPILGFGKSVYHGPHGPRHEPAPKRQPGAPARAGSRTKGRATPPAKRPGTGRARR